MDTFTFKIWQRVRVNIKDSKDESVGLFDGTVNGITRDPETGEVLYSVKVDGYSNLTITVAKDKLTALQ